LAAIDEKFLKMEDRLVEKMRDMRTALQRSFAVFTEAQTIPCASGSQSNQSGLDGAVSG
jgi:hypothetical protein